MNTKSKLIISIIAVTAVLVAIFQTVYRAFYDTFPWSVDKFHTVKYVASLQFINPDTMSALMIVTGFAVLLTVLVFYREPNRKEPCPRRDAIVIALMAILALVCNVIPFYLLIAYGRP